MFGIILVGVAALCAFTFPAFLIDAIKEEDAETSKTARKMSCVIFGILMLIIGAMMILFHW